jgi:hypothetical protein
VRIGATLGLYQTLYKQGALTSAEPADASGLYERYVREWLAYNAASNYVS